MDARFAQKAQVPQHRASRSTNLLPARLPFRNDRDWWRCIPLVLAVLLAYLPVWRAGFVWDDSAILTANPCIVGPLGFRQIWTTQYADVCPLTLSALWLEHALWGLSPLPYHVVNVLLHAANALLLWQVLRSLRVPGAWLGSALWSLHPVEVASVAWVAELKNTLSGVFFLASVFWFLSWLKAREQETPPRVERVGGGRWLFYGLSLFCAALAMASKSSTVVLPAVLWLCAWWMEGRVRWRQAVSLSPLFSFAAVTSVVTLWTQRMTLAQMTWALPIDAPRVRPWGDRLVAAGDAVWFYLGKLLWPHPLVAIYPPWQIEAKRLLEWLPLLILVPGLWFLWRQRASLWGRACLFAFTYFLLALLPVLGLVAGTSFCYSPAFDHFQYLASMGPLALIGAGMVRLAQLTLPGKAWQQGALGAGVLLVLGSLSWRRCETYQDEETFWTNTVAYNPDGWLGRGNLGNALLLKGEVDRARAQYERALVSNPDYAVAHDNLGVLFLRQGKLEPAIVHLERAVSIAPDYAEAHSNLGNAFLAAGQADAAIDQYEKALAIKPDSAVVHFNLGNAYFAQGHFDQATSQYERALAINGNYAEAHSNLGNAFLAERHLDAAIAQYEKALSIDADYAEAHNNLGVAFLRTARFNEAILQFEDAARLAPNYPNVQSNLATAQMLSRRARLSR